MRMPRRDLPLLVALVLFPLTVPLAAQDQPSGSCNRTIKANVVALDQPYMLNRLGASMPIGMVYALARDVMPKAGGTKTCATAGLCQPGEVVLAKYKRPRPIVLRANMGDCMVITFTNLLSKAPVVVPGVAQQPATRAASIHAAGMQMVKDIKDDGSWVGTNATSLAQPGQTVVYNLFAEKEGTYLLNSDGAAFGGDNAPNDGAQVTAGLFGAVNVQPTGAEWYRSQVTAEVLANSVDKSKGTQGWTPDGLPFVDYQAKGPDGVPLLNMLDDGFNLVYTDLTAIITGPRTNGFLFKPTGKDDPLFQYNYAEPDRIQPYREFSILYHELNDSQQAFPIFGNTTTKFPISGNGTYRTLLAPGADMFAINYGAGGIGAEILGSRFGVGPMASCPDCAFEEFFLSAWASGDPAMVVDVPANVPCSNKPSSQNNANVTATGLAGKPCRDGVIGNAPSTPTQIYPFRKATVAYYPDDPSNVYHSYINDHTKFRIIHAGTGVAHVHHQHAHQWLHTPNSDQSTYLDSQLINPGSAYTLEMTYNGSGNRNKVVGDSIFHCHFYPHFAAGMWALWRTHDVFEAGTKLDANGRPVKGVNRALPDSEIAEGTPIPALVPLPNLGMAPAPEKLQLVRVDDPNTSSTAPPVGYRAKILGDKNPGYPFFIPGVAGTRAPHPPLDFATDDAGLPRDGGLPRHLILNAKVTEEHTTTDFSRDMANVNAYKLDEQGTPEEKSAMLFHEQCLHPSMTPLGVSSPFHTNGLPRASGAPYANPGRDPNEGPDECHEIKDWIRYKAAVVQTDLVLNKKGWHYPQSRFLTLWGDVTKTFSGDRPPQPFFFRAASGVGIEYWHTNLVPRSYLLDDWQVKTPTDVIGQHIHLVKFDVTSSDGAGNGWNYEDGTFAPDEVRDRIAAINQCGGLAGDLMSIAKCGSGTRKPLTAQPVPAEICGGPVSPPCPSGQNWNGAQTTVQRWFADPLEGTDFGEKNKDRTLRTVFTHDHFSPSTHQQVGLYAALLVEPPTSKWYVNDATATEMGTRTDGGPTSWEAMVVTDGSARDTYREFALALEDFQFAYRPTSPNAPDAVTGWACPTSTVESTNPCNIIAAPGDKCVQKGCDIEPQLISSGPTSGTLSFNYRNEPLPFRVATGTSTDSRVTDLSYVFASLTNRNDPQMNTQPKPGSSIGTGSSFIYPKVPLNDGMMPGDPFTPLLRAYENDNVQIRLIAGAHMLPHDFTVLGMHWLFEPSFADSGYRNNQGIGISEHFEFLFQVPRSSPVAAGNPNNWADYLYMPDASNQTHGVIDGMWGIFRAYKSEQAFLKTLPTNPKIQPLPPAKNAARGYSCPDGLPDNRYRTFNLVAQAPGQIVYNSRGAAQAGTFNNKIFNQYALQYVLEGNENSTEPLVLRANAGDCIGISLKNTFNTTGPLFNGTVKSYAAFDPLQTIPLMTSPNAGLTAGILSYDVMTSNGINVGFNPDQVVAANASPRTYWWYAGNTSISSGGVATGMPVEFGGVNLTPSDPLEQDLHGLVGAMVIEPPQSVACPDTGTYASATIYRGGTCSSPGTLLFRDFVMITQDNLANVLWQGATAQFMTQNGPKKLTSEGSATISSINYRTEPMSYRFNNFSLVTKDVQSGFSDVLVRQDPQTPIFSAAQGTPVRFHLTHPGGSGNQQVFTFHGHVWQELPFTNGSASIGDNRESQNLGSRDIYGTNSAYVLDIPRAGGKNAVMGDYLYRTIPANFLLTNGGLWGLFRVAASNTDTIKITTAAYTQQFVIMIFGSVTPYLNTSTAPAGKPAVGTTAQTLTLTVPGLSQPVTVNVGDNGSWSYTSPGMVHPRPSGQVVATSAYGGMASATLVDWNVVPPSSTLQPFNDDSSNFVDPPRPHTGKSGTEPANPKRSAPAPKSSGSSSSSSTTTPKPKSN
jgi:hypothetical protein